MRGGRGPGSDGPLSRNGRNHKKEARGPAHGNLAGGQASGGVDKIVAGELHVRQLSIPIVLAFVDDHSQHLGHCVVNALHTVFTAWIVGAGGDLSNTQKLMYSMCESLEQNWRPLFDGMLRGHSQRRIYLG